MIQTEQTSFLALLKLGIGQQVDSFPDNINWNAIEALAKQQGLLGVLVDGINHLPQTIRPTQKTWLRWIGEVMQEYEGRYEKYVMAVAALAAFYNERGYRMMILKGLACGMNWRRPEHRPYGDIDIWLFGQQKEADITLMNDCGIKVDNNHHHHSVFLWHGFTVENHYDFVNVHRQKSNVELEYILKKLGADYSHSIYVCCEKLYEPSPNLHALFLVKHMISHFAADKITFRQLLDWAFFVEKHGSEVDWDLLQPMLDSYHMCDFFNCLNAICVEDLGFDVSIFPNFQFCPALKDRVLKDIFTPVFIGGMPNNLFKRVIWKYHRWKANEWKRDFCYKEGKISALWSGVKNHLLKPASI